MKKRVDALRRIEKLTAQMHELDRWRLAGLEQEQLRLFEDLRAAFEGLQATGLAYGAPAKLSARHIGRLERRLEAISREQARLSDRTRSHGVRSKLASSAAEAAAFADRDRKQRQDLAEIAQHEATRRGASPR